MQKYLEVSLFCVFLHKQYTHTRMNYPFPIVKLSYSHTVPYKDLREATDPATSAALLREIYDADTIAHVETFGVLLLNQTNKVLGYYQAATGGRTGVHVDPATIMQAAILSNATAIIVAHNHPSGALKASAADKEMTRRIKEACALFNMQLLDHIILTPTGEFLSFADEGLL